MSNTIDTKFILRFHAPEMRKQLKEMAERSHRSLNGQLLYLIERGMQAASADDDKAKRIEALERTEVVRTKEAEILSEAQRFFATAASSVLRNRKEKA